MPQQRKTNLRIDPGQWLERAASTMSVLPILLFTLAWLISGVLIVNQGFIVQMFWLVILVLLTSKLLRTK